MHDNYIQGSWRRYHTNYHKPPTPRHVGHILRIVQNTTGRLFDRDPHKLTDKIDWLNDNFAQDTLDSIHKQVCDGYRSGEYKKRGRAFASPNKSKSSGYSPNKVENMSRAVDYKPYIPYVSNGHAESSTPSETAAIATALNVDYLSTVFVKKAIFDNHDNQQANDIARLEQSIAVTDGAVKLAFEKINLIQDNRPTVVHIAPINAPTIDMGVQHCTFPTLCKYAAAGVHIWLYGPAGTGKSKACENMAKALGREFRTDGKLSEDVHLMGYKDAHSFYNSTQFRDAYENGHVYCADEIDGWLPDALIALNNALANGHCSFRDKIVTMHPNFLFIGAANTTGKGGTIEYVARFQHDAAFLDRFVTLEFPHDDGLENHLVSNTEWLNRVRHVRNRLSNSTIKNHLITMRASIFGQRLIAAGIDQEQVEKSTLRKGLTDAQWAMIK